MRFRSLALVLALSSSSLLGCGGGGGTDESVSGVFPSSAFLGRQVRVEISGDATEWKDGATVDFGPGVTVTSVKVASPTALFAEITIAPDAPLGARDVVVTNGSDKLTLAEAFLLESAIKIEFQGSLAQGSLATFSINNRDFDTPFDATFTGDGFFTPIEYTNTFIEGPTGTEFFIDSMTPYSITGTALFNVDSSSGAFVVNSGLEEKLVKSSLGANLEVAARTATALTAGAPASVTVGAPLESSLFEFTPTGTAVVSTLRATGTGSPSLIVLGSSGQFADFVSQGRDNAIVTTSPSKVYAVFLEGSGNTGSYTVTANTINLTSINESEPANNAPATAQTVSKTALVAAASLADEGDTDWYAIDAVAGDVGKRIVVKTGGNDPLTDTVVAFASGVNGGTAFGSESSDADFHEYHRSPAITAAGRYWVKITPSDFFDPGHKNYIAAIWLE